MQVVNSLLGLLVFPLEQEKTFFATLSKLKFPDPSNIAMVRAMLVQRLSTPSLDIRKFGACNDLGKFFKRVRNAIAHKHLEFPGADPDSRIRAATKRGIPV